MPESGAPFTPPPFPPPPPPYFIPPPPPFRGGFPPRPEFEEEIFEEIEIDKEHLALFKDAGYEEVEENPSSSENGENSFAAAPSAYFEGPNYDADPNFEHKDKMPEKKGKDLVDDVELKRLQIEIQKNAEQMEAIALEKERRVSFLKTVLIIILSGALLSGLGVLVTWVLTSSKANSYSDRMAMSEEDDGISPEEKDEKKFWKLPNSEANNIVKKFYKATGLFETLSRSRDELMRGTATIQGKNYALRVIKNRNGNTYLKTTDTNGVSSAYFIPEYTLGRKLLTPTVSGPSQALEFAENEALKSLFLFDEVLLAKAFPFGGLSSDSRRIEIVRGKDSPDKTLCSLKITTPSRTYEYFFDKQSGDIKSICYEAEQMSFKILFSDKKIFSDGLKFPEKREIFINDKPFATLHFSTLSRINEMLLFPH
ncbi:MAG: hypothetical protein SPI34_00100 [Opitutales bacterium]|nr:hypothetical protein [Opitutales bacterium]